MIKTRKVLLHPACPSVSSSVDAGMGPSETVGALSCVSSRDRINTQTVASSRLVIVVDDSPTIRNILETCLSQEGFVVHTFSDGIEMMRWLTGSEGCVPDLVILDINLPKMDGYEVARRLKAKPRFAQSIIVMLSRRDSMIDRLKGRLAGASAYLTKPFQIQELVSIVKTQRDFALSDEHAVLHSSTTTISQ